MNRHTYAPYFRTSRSFPSWFFNGGLERELSGLLSTPGTGQAELPLNLYETEEQYLLEAELPGTKEDELEITVKGNEVTLRIKPAAEGADDKSAYTRRERVRREITRVVRLSAELDPARVEAQLKDGVLSLRLPKAETARARKIPVVTH